MNYPTNQLPIEEHTLCYTLLGPKLTTNTAHNSAQHKLKNQIPTQEGLFEKSKKLSILQNHHPELLNNWRSYPTFHKSLLSAYKRNDVHGVNFMEPLPESTEEEVYKIKSIIEGRDLPILPNKKVAPLENIIWNQNRIYRSGNLFHQENRLILTRHPPSAFSILPNYRILPGIQFLTRIYWHPCLNHDSFT